MSMQDRMKAFQKEEQERNQSREHAYGHAEYLHKEDPDVAVARQAYEDAKAVSEAARVKFSETQQKEAEARKKLREVLNQYIPEDLRDD